MKNGHYVGKIVSHSVYGLPFVSFFFLICVDTAYHPTVVILHSYKIGARPRKVALLTEIDLPFALSSLYKPTTSEL